MSSREILFNNPSEEKDGSPAPAQGRPLSLHRKVLEHTPSGSLKHLTDPLASPVKNPALVSSSSVDIPLEAEIPEASQPVLMPESLVSTKSPLPVASEVITDGGKLGQSHNSTAEHQSLRLKGESQQGAMKKFRPPDKLEKFTPEIGGHNEVKGRRAQHHRGHQYEATSQGSTNGNGKPVEGCSVSTERKRNSGQLEEMEMEMEAKREDEVPKTNGSR